MPGGLAVPPSRQRRSGERGCSCPPMGEINDKLSSSSLLYLLKCPGSLVTSHSHRPSGKSTPHPAQPRHTHSPSRKPEPLSTK
eukprot:scaffold35269_cov34-Tisochrysis_lutea.AAC.1